MDLAHAFIKGINWDDEREIQNIIDLAERFNSIYIESSREFIKYSREKNMSDRMINEAQEKTIKELIKELSFYKALSFVLDIKLKALKLGEKSPTLGKESESL